VTGVTIRRAEAVDLRELAAIRIRSWRAAYAGLVSQDHLAAMDAEEGHRRWAERAAAPGAPQVLVAETATAALGYAIFGSARDEDLPASAGEVWAIYLDPPCWGRGVGRQLLAAAVAEFRAGGRDPIVLWVLTGNARARRFYEAAGFRCDGAARDITIGGEELPEVRYRLTGQAVAAPGPGSDWWTPR